MKQKLLSMALALTMLLSLMPASALAAPATTFSDVDANDWFHTEVQYVKEKGLMNGTSDTTFTPGGNTTRGMIVTILHRLAGEPAAAASTFQDVAANQYYANAVDWAAANGVVTGYNTTTFGPNDFITREQLAAILFRYATLMGYDVSVGEDTNILSWPDALSVSPYAVSAMQWAVGAGLVNGTDGKLAPQGLATRAQVAAILYRFCTQVAEDVTPATFTVTLKWNDGTSNIYKTFSVEEGKTITAPQNPTRSGYTFGGWSTSTASVKLFDFSQAITGDVILFAQWSKVATHSHSYTIVNNENGTHSKVCRCDRTITEACTVVDGTCSVCGDTTVYVSSINGIKYASLQDALDAANGGTVTLLSNVDLAAPLTVSGDVTLNLNGKTITNTNDLWNQASGDFALITVNDGTLTVTGGTLSPKENDCYPFHVNGGDLIIEDGAFAGNVSAVYVTKGTATILGGSFTLMQKAPGLDSDTSRYLLNCLDENYKNDTANIVVKGGTFAAFDPANNASEGAGTNLVADGYASLPSGDNWIVTKGSSTSGYEASSAEELAAAAQQGASVTMTDSVAAGEKLTLNGGTLNGGNKTLTFDAQSTTATINVGISAKNGADISNLTIADNTKVTGTDNQPRVLRAIYLEGPGDFIVENVYIVSQGYALNTGVMGSGSSLAVSNSTLAGWTSFDGVIPATFTKCVFADEGQLYKYVRTYVDVTFKECSFDNGYTLDVADGKGVTITLTDCYVNGELVTDSNKAALLNLDEYTAPRVIISNTTL